MTEALRRLIDADRIDDSSVAVDVGAGDGAWSALLSPVFSRVLAFERDEDRFEALRDNLLTCGNVECRQRLVLDRNEFKIDDFELAFCGLLRIGAAGDEPIVLRGAERTIRRCQPVIIVECAGRVSREGHGPRATVGLLLSLGYRELLRAGPDRVFVPN